jgi:hypothetical protein
MSMRFRLRGSCCSVKKHTLPGRPRPTSVELEHANEGPVGSVHMDLIGCSGMLRRSGPAKHRKRCRTCPPLCGPKPPQINPKENDDGESEQVRHRRPARITTRVGREKTAMRAAAKNATVRGSAGELVVSRTAVPGLHRWAIFRQRSDLARSSDLVLEGS